MPPIVRAAVLLMVAALACYSLGVWAEFLGGRLRPWHLACFWSGFLCDTAGTELMRRLAGGLHPSLHTLTGIAALLLMLGHALWASVVVARRDDRAARSFHRISIVVWTIWLVPFVTGIVLGRRHGAPVVTRVVAFPHPRSSS
jgi:uncharacterized repeat protein (TIGR03987 family)